MERIVCCKYLQAAGQFALTFRDAKGIKKTTLGFSVIM
jgi:hypothetical protein